MLKPLLIAAALTTFGSAAVYAQTTAPAPAPQAQDRMGAPAIAADTRKLIGRNVQNAQNETIGEIEAIYLDKDGRVDSVIIGVGGFLGLGERNVRVAWKDLVVSSNGEKVTTAYTKDQLKAMPEYKYREPGYRGQVFTDTGIQRDGSPAPRATTVDRTTPPPASVPNKPTKDFNADGHMSSDAILKASVRNAANETIGEIEDVYVDKDGRIQTVVVSVGGFLGIGKKHVAVKWTEFQMRRDGNTLILLSNWTKDALKAMPDYTYDREEAARK